MSSNGNYENINCCCTYWYIILSMAQRSLKMVKKSIKISDEDFTYFIKVTDALKEFEQRIAALEITKMRLFDEYKILNDSLANFSAQLKDKYNVPVANASIDDSTKSIVFEVEEDEKKEIKEQKKVAKKSKEG